MNVDQYADLSHYEDLPPDEARPVGVVEPDPQFFDEVVDVPGESERTPMDVDEWGESSIPEQRPSAVGQGSSLRHRTVLIDGEILAVAEGDLLVPLPVTQLHPSDEVLDAPASDFRTRAVAGPAEPADTADASSTFEAALVGVAEDGRLIRWAPETLLSYCVLRATFPREDWYEEVVENMHVATREWEQACGVRFQHVAAADSSQALKPREVLFPVRHIAANGAFIASAFFPNDAPNRRRVLIDPSYHGTAFSHVGVLRHELGHVLGFRHEHIRSGAPAVCPDEDASGALDLTAYDPKSVMHYFCGGVGTRNLDLTDVDRAGARALYGPSLEGFHLQYP